MPPSLDLSRAQFADGPDSEGRGIPESPQVTIRDHVLPEAANWQSDSESAKIQFYFCFAYNMYHFQCTAEFPIGSLSLTC